MHSETAERELTTILQQVLPGQALKRCRLPQVPEIELLLFDDHGMHRALDDEEAEAVYLHTPYWLFCWASGQAMAAWLFENPETVRGKRVLDFGSGSGVVAIAAACCGADVVAYDEDERACRASQINAAINGVSINAVSSLQHQADSFEPYDLILAADVLYDQANLHLLDFFLTLGQHVLVADSRLKTMPHTAYKLLTSLESKTLPDMGELAMFSDVRLYTCDFGRR